MDLIETNEPAPPSVGAEAARPDPKRWLVLAVVLIGMFMAVVDTWAEWIADRAPRSYRVATGT